MKKIILDVKPFQETLHAGMCGPASLKIVLDYYGLEKSEKELAELTGHTTDKGVTNESMVKAVQNLGFKVDMKNENTFEDIESWLNKGVPVIVDWFTRGRSDYADPDSEIAEGHASVVIGLDDEYVYLQDPEIGGLRKLTRDRFMKVWFDFSSEYIKPDELVIRNLIAIYK